MACGTCVKHHSGMARCRCDSQPGSSVILRFPHAPQAGAQRISEVDGWDDALVRPHPVIFSEVQS
jgi:hypothetical protein